MGITFFIQILQKIKEVWVFFLNGVLVLPLSQKLSHNVKTTI